MSHYVYSSLKGLEDSIVYKNAITMLPGTNWDVRGQLNVTCVIPRGSRVGTAFVAVRSEFSDSLLTRGNVTVDMSLYTDANFLEKAEIPATYRVGQPIYVGVDVISTDLQLEASLENCSVISSPTSAPRERGGYTLLDNR